MVYSVWWAAARAANWARSSALSGPARFANASASRSCPRAMAPIVKRCVLGAHCLAHPVVEGAGHVLQEDAGTRLGEIVADFMA